MSNLTPQHYQELLESAIDPEIIDLNFQSLSGDAAIEAVKYQVLAKLDTERLTPRAYTSKQNYIYSTKHLRDGGLWCSGLDPFKDWDEMRWGSLKPDKPRLEPDASGKLKPVKYEHPGGGTPTRAFFLRVTWGIGLKVAIKAGEAAEKSYRERMGAFVFDLSLEDCGFWQWVLENNIPIIITEGAKKAASLLSAGYAAIGLPGINGAVRTKDKNKIPCKPFLIPEIKLFATKDRKISICFDHDIKPKTIKDVNREIGKLGELLIPAGSDCRVVSLPGPEKGVDDFLVAQGESAFDFLYISSPDCRFWQYKKGHELTHKPDLIVNCKYLGKLPYPARGMCLIKSTQGTGKTQSLIELISEARRDGRPVLVITHRIELGRAICEAIGINWIEDCKESVEGKLFGFGLCVDSLHPLSQARFNPDDWDDAIVILDEVEQILWHMMNSSTCVENRSIIINNFEALIKNVIASGGLVIAQDADLSDVSINYLMEISGDVNLKPFIIVNRYLGNGRDVILYNFTQPIKLFIEMGNILKLGLKIFIGTDSQKVKGLWSAINLESHLKKLFPDKRILRIDSTTVGNPEHPAFCCAKNINEIVKNYDIVIATPTIGTGVSIDLKGHFAAVFGLFYGAITTHDAIQMLNRVRDLGAAWHIWANKVGVGRVGNGCSFAGGLIGSKGRVARKNLELIGKSDRDGFELGDKVNERHTELWATMGARINAGQWHYRNNICSLLVHAGHRVKTEISLVKEPLTHEETKAKNSAIEVRQENRQADAELVANAEPITESRYKILKEKRAKTTSESAQERRYCLEENYAVEVTPELVIKDADKWLSKIKLHYYLLHPELAKERDTRHLETAEKNGDGQLQLQDLKFVTAKVAILQGLNILSLFDSEKIFTSESPEIVAIANVLTGAKDISDYLGDRPDSKLSPIRIIQNFLRGTLGFTLKSTQVKRDGKKVREYRFEGVGDKRYMIFEAWDKKTAEYNERMGVVPPESYTLIEKMVVPLEADPTPEKMVVPDFQDVFRNLKGKIVVNTKTGRPDRVVEYGNYSTWITQNNDSVSPNDLREGIWQLPTVDNVARWIRFAIKQASVEKAKWLFENFGVGPNNLMDKAMDLFIDEFAPIYDIYDLVG
jgi:hypothetical protein